ncbi:hypothetical protein [Mesorhizobium sp. M1A.F.Ca.ET.072.01.1.1]|uniref:hypothetical protein n=1 Tax=Mesorhizobium sp. M1A.F.Ca.ET.072.01.1.1 TaxID=2496753 RepID=UPI001FDF4633|nr:hypothetical protein [Mesorhizobium sp. M1A.F.Ca.ET.072.01.1.1]
MAGKKKIMNPSDVPDFVDAVIEAGCDICAIDDFGYVMVDIRPRRRREVDRVCEEFGERRHLKFAIIAYLRSIGRFVDLDSTAEHWSENFH